jgi:tetratricopeptide (TPR) repeat protein
LQVEECPQCGAPASPSDKKCNFCKCEFFVASLSYVGSFDKGAIDKYINHYKELAKTDPENGEAIFSLGLCYLQLKLFPLAQKNFERATELIPEYPDVYYYYALSIIKGRRVKSLTLKEIKSIEQYLNTAIQLDQSKAKYYYLSAILKYDYYRMNGLAVPAPAENELIEEAKTKVQEPEEIQRLLDSIIVRDENFISLIIGLSK